MFSRHSPETQRALEHLKQLKQELADRPYVEGDRIPNKNFNLVAELLKGIGSALPVLGEPSVSPGPEEELLVDWEPPKPEIHVVVAEGKIHGWAYTSTGELHGDNLAEVIKLVLRAAGVVPPE